MRKRILQNLLKVMLPPACLRSFSKMAVRLSSRMVGVVSTLIKRIFSLLTEIDCRRVSEKFLRAVNDSVSVPGDIEFTYPLAYRTARMISFIFSSQG